MSVKKASLCVMQRAAQQIANQTGKPMEVVMNNLVPKEPNETKEQKVEEMIVEEEAEEYGFNWSPIPEPFVYSGPVQFPSDTPPYQNTDCFF